MKHSLYLYLTTYLILFQSNPIFKIISPEWSVTFLMFFLIIIFNSYKKLPLQFLLYMSLFLFLTFYHLIFITSSSFFSDIRFLMLIFSAFIIASQMKEDFLFYFVRIMKYLSISSLFIWFIYLIFCLILGHQSVFNLFDDIGYIYNASSSPLLESNDRLSLLIYNFTNHSNLWYRNFGFTWEPGVFAFYNAIALIFYDFLYKTNYKLKEDHKYIFIFAILSSFSTTGYVFLIVYLLFRYLLFILSRSDLKSKIVRIPFLVVLFIIALAVFFNFDFIYKKIVSNFSTDLKSASFYSGRLNFIYEWSRIKNNILFGSGFFTRQITSNEFFMVSNFNSLNGLVGLLRSWGIIGFLVTNYFFYKSIQVLSGKNHFVITGYLFLVLLLAMSQNIFNHLITYILLTYKFTK